jgi:16S rRNA (uracil1498-N3)-methyltransferase
VNLFFAPDLSANALQLEGEEFRHCTQSFRQHVGDHILLTDGKGTRAEALIDDIKKRSLTAIIKNRSNPGTRRPYTLEIALAPTKNINRIEWFVEKSIELGIDSISFLLTHHSERRKIRLDRLHRIAVAALKQAHQYKLPTFRPLQTLEDYIESQPIQGDDRAYLAHFTPNSPSLSAEHTTKGNYRVMIGPEGDFSSEEVSYIREAGWTDCTLGEQRLRTETAALSAVAYFHWLHA